MKLAIIAVFYGSYINTSDLIHEITGSLLNNIIFHTSRSEGNLKDELKVITDKRLFNNAENIQLYKYEHLSIPPK